MQKQLILYLLIQFIKTKCEQYLLDNQTNNYIILPFNQSDCTTLISINNNKTATKLTLDTMSFYTMIYKQYINNAGRYFKEIKSYYSYRYFEGYENYLYFSGEDNSYSFSHVLLESMANKPNNLKIYPNTTNGVLGLGRKYSYNVMVLESFYFGVSPSYSFMHYVKRANRISENVFSIYKDKFILGKPPINEDSLPHIHKCVPENFLDVVYEHFFWNCPIDKMDFFGYKKEDMFWNYVVIDTLLLGISLPNSFSKQIEPALSNKSNNHCMIKEKIVTCDKTFNIELLEDIHFVLKNNIDLVFKAKQLFYYNTVDDNYSSYIQFTESTQVISIGGLLLFNQYFVTFNNEKGYIGIGELDLVNLNLKNKRDFLFFITHTINIILIWNIFFMLFIKQSLNYWNK